MLSDAQDVFHRRVWELSEVTNVFHRRVWELSDAQDISEIHGALHHLLKIIIELRP